MIEWQIFYGDGSTFNSDDGDWEDAPANDVQVVIFKENDRWVLRHGGDFFRMDEDGAIVNLDIFGLVDYAVNVIGHIKQGRFLSTKKFHIVRQEAKDLIVELEK